MDFLNLAKTRYSVRKFDARPIERSQLNQVLEAGRLAPTACNFQPQRILVVTDRQKNEKLKEATPYTFDAPAILAVCYDQTQSWKRRHDGDDSGVVDASIVATHMMLAAHAIGLGTTWVASFDPKKAREVLEIPPDDQLVCLLPIGYPSSDAKPSENHEKREAMEHTVAFNCF